MRARGSASSDKIGSLPFDANGLKNLGCTGGLSYSEWSETTVAERAASEHNRWCQVSYSGMIGWVAGRFLGEGNAPQQVAAGISSKPMVYMCDGLGTPLTLVLIATDPGIAFLRWRNTAEVLVAVPAASGGKYQSDTPEWRFEFWFKGDEAMFTLPGETALGCKLDETG
ncbi:MAG: membrane-bound inhibitor of C-type lysozyme [Paracoccaceae bacterium]|jgi:membrane-bound inhibitor of C-type lysozyme